MTIMMVSRMAPPKLSLKYQYRPNSGTASAAIPRPVFRKSMSMSWRPAPSACAEPRSPRARPMPWMRDVRRLYRV